MLQQSGEPLTSINRNVIMYCNHFGFQEKPFEITPDPQYLFLSPSHKETLASLVYGFRERRGFIVIVGEVGTGKTTVLNAAIDRFKPFTKVAYISYTCMNFEQVLHHILIELGATESKEPLSRIRSIQVLNDIAIEQLSQGGNVLLIVDEAQNLSADAMENLRQLSNLETRKHKLIQIVLSGQPELEIKLQRPELRQLAQRVSIRRSVSPLTEEETYHYLQYRLKLAGYGGGQLFDIEAQQLIYAYSGGIPRKINVLCDNSLLIGYALKNKRVLASYVEESAMDLNWTLPPDSQETLQPAYEVPDQREPICEERAQRVPSYEELVLRKHKYAARVQRKRSNFTARSAAFLAVVLLSAFAGWMLLAKTNSTLKAPKPIMHEEKTSLASSPLLNDGRTQKAKPPNGADRTTDATPAQFGAGEPSTYPIENERTVSEPNEEKARAPNPTMATTMVPRMNAEVTAARKPPHIILKQLAKDRPVADQKVSSRHEIIKSKPYPEKTFEVVVGPGDTIYDIVRRAFGTYDKRFLDRVLKWNPEIAGSGKIYPGQVIRIPVVPK